MASTYTNNTGLEKPGNGEQVGTWGITANTNYNIIDRLVSGVGAITLSGTTHTLTTSDAVLSEGHYKVLVFGGSPSGTNTVTISPNDQTKAYWVRNASGESVILTQGSGGNVTVANGESAFVYADGGGSGAAVVDLTALLPAPSNIAFSQLADAAVQTSGEGFSDSDTALMTAALIQDFIQTATLTLTNKTLGGVTLNDGYTEEVYAVSGTTPALSPTNGSIQTWTLSANSTPTAGTWAAGQMITLLVDDGTDYTITWSSLSVEWKTNAGAAPTLNTADETVIVLWKVGTTIYGAQVGDS